MITILIVDDEKLERRGIRFLLKREEGEFQILEATNGKDALGVLESNHVDILFSDVKMPYMNGLELTKAVREDHPDMEIVIFSGYNDFSYAREAFPDEPEGRGAERVSLCESEFERIHLFVHGKICRLSWNRRENVPFFCAPV